MILVLTILIFHVPPYGLTYNFWYCICTCAVPPQTLVGLLKHNVIPMSWETLATLSERCRDPSVSVKKKALHCVDELLTVSLEGESEDILQNKFNIYFRLNQNATWCRRHGSRVWCQQWLILRAQSRIKLWRFWTRCCSAKSSCSLPTATWTRVKDLPGTWWAFSVTSARIFGQICSLLIDTFYLKWKSHRFCMKQFYFVSWPSVKVQSKENFAFEKKFTSEPTLKMLNKLGKKNQFQDYIENYKNFK